MKTDKSFYIAVGLFITLVYGIVYYVFQFNGLYGQDSHEYFRYSGELANSITKGTEVNAFFWPTLYPLIGACISIVFGNLLTVLQLLSIISLGAFLIAMFHLLKLYNYNREYSAYYVLILGGLSPFIMRNSVVVMSDVLALAFLSWSLVLGTKYYKENNSLSFVLSSLLGSLAVFTRFQSAIILLPIFAILAVITLQRRQVTTLLFALMLAVIPVVIHLFIQQGNVEGVSSHYGLQQWSISHFFQSKFSGPDGVLVFNFPNILYTTTSWMWPGLFSVGLIGALFLRRSHLSNPIIIVGILVYFLNALFLAGPPFQNSRHHLLIMPIILLVFAAPIEVLLRKIATKQIKHFLIISFSVAQTLLCIRALYPTISNGLLQKEIAHYLHHHYPGKTVYTMGIDMALKSYQIDLTVVNTYSEKLSDFQEGELFLINENWQTQAFQNMNPAINWEEAKKYHPKHISEFKDGWSLYQLGDQQ
jgi:hypothetical protein